MSVHNMMEELVTDCLKEVLNRHADLETQLDSKAQSDVKAIALNHLPPRYVATAKGEVFTKTQLRTQHESDVFQEIYRAVEKVLGAERKTDF